MSHIAGTAKSEHDRLGNLRRKIVVAKQTRVENSDRRDGVVVLHLVRFGAATTVACRHDARAVDVQAVRSTDDPFYRFGHPVCSRRSAAATRLSRRDCNKTVRGELGQEVLRGRAIVATGSVTPNEHWHWGIWTCGRRVDGVP
jgi:hypothetical protein